MKTTLPARLGLHFYAELARQRGNDYCLDIASLRPHTVVVDSVSPLYYAHEILRRAEVPVDTLNELSEHEVTRVRAAFKNITFGARLWGEGAANRLLDELTGYMASRFPKRGSTPMCEAVRP